MSDIKSILCRLYHVPTDKQESGGSSTALIAGVVVGVVVAIIIILIVVMIVVVVIVMKTRESRRSDL